MANTVVLKRSAVAGKIPSTSDLELGEIALNTYDGNLFFKKTDGVNISVVSVATTNGAQTLSNKTLVNPIIAAVGGDEGGEILLGKPQTNTTLVGTGITIDAYQNKLRVFEQGGTARGVFIDISTAGGGVSSEIITNNGTQTLTNKTLNGAILTGALTAGGNTGANGYLLASTGSGVQWVANTAGTLDGLGDVTITAPAAQQVLKYNGSIWQNADPDSAVASAVFATNAQSDLGLVTDLVVAITEDLGVVTEVAAYIYNMGTLVVDGIVSLNNIDQSIKADYIAYSIIFGF